MELINFLKQLNINPQDLFLYNLAFTHPSSNLDANTKDKDYEKLEYMGDAVIDFVTASLIYQNRKEMNEGDMSKLRSYIVRSSSLAGYARKLKLNEQIKLGHSLNKIDVYSSDKIMEDVFEALIGAIYLDRGIEESTKFIEKIMINDIKTLSKTDIVDAKTRLQEEMAAEHREVNYVLKEQSGPAHDRTFTVEVYFENILLATGTGKSKKAAEEDAADKALRKRII